jgi:hypothetical protein
MTDTDVLIERVIETIRAVWGVCASVGAVVVLYALPWWAIFPYALAVWVSYFITLIVAGCAIAVWLPRPEFSEEESSDIDDVQDPRITSATLVAHSEPFGRIGDQDLYEWIDLQDGEVVLRYDYVQVAEKDAGGNSFIPAAPGHAHLRGVIYRNIQPEQD